MSGGFLHVVAGALVDSADRVLIAQRPAGKHLAGGWEFPGGKLDPGEARATGLARELREEIGIDIQHCRPLIRLRHSYPDRDVLLDVWLVDRFSGTPRALDHQALRWCTRDELQHADLLAADRAVIAALRLPAVIDAPSGEHYDLIPIGQLPAQRSPSKMRGVSCHSPADAIAAEQGGADFIVADAAWPEQALTHVCDQVNLPVFAAGIDLETAWRSGATGISRCAPLSDERQRIS